MKFWDVVEFLNNDNLLLYKHECEDFNTNTKLIVREGQVALFIKNGVLCDTFYPGRYTLKTENIPLLSKIVRKFTTGGVNSYSAELFFVSTVDQMNIKWGTRSPMDLQDPVYKIIAKVGASGESTFVVTDPMSFIKKISGTSTSISIDSLSNYFRSIINTYIKNCISDSIIINKVSLLQMNSCLLSLSQACCQYLNKTIVDYGICAKNFTIEAISISENDPSLQKLRSILEKRAEMDILGYSYQEERSFNVMDNATSNTATAGIANSLMGIGLGFGLATPMGQGVANIASNVQVQHRANANPAQTMSDTWNCDCGANNIQSRFCPDCGKERVIKASSWNCARCGKTDIQSTFCPDCGAKRIEHDWDCECGERGIKSNFCPTCGNRRK